MSTPRRRIRIFLSLVVALTLIILPFPGWMIFSTNIIERLKNDDGGLSSSLSSTTTLRFNTSSDSDADGRPTNLRISFLGDSTCRHLFLSLTHYLHSGRPITFNNDTQRIITGAFPTRKEYRDYISNRFHGTLSCDCHIPEGPFIPWGRDHMIWRNIYYKEGTNSVTHITKSGYFDAHGHWDPVLFYTNSTYRDDVRLRQYPNGRFDWEGNWTYAIRHHIAQLVPKPEYVVINAGLWPNDLLQNNTLPEIRNALDDAGMIGIYKTTNKQLGETTPGLMPQDEEGCRILHHCLNLSWTSTVNDEREYLDKAHFGPRMNQNFTVQLLDLLRDISKT